MHYADWAQSVRLNWLWLPPTKPGALPFFWAQKRPPPWFSRFLCSVAKPQDRLNKEHANETNEQVNNHLLVKPTLAWRWSRTDLLA